MGGTCTSWRSNQRVQSGTREQTSKSEVQTPLFHLCWQAPHFHGQGNKFHDNDGKVTHKDNSVFHRAPGNSTWCFLITNLLIRDSFKQIKSRIFRHFRAWHKTQPAALLGNKRTCSEPRVGQNSCAVHCAQNVKLPFKTRFLPFRSICQRTTRSNRLAHNAFKARSQSRPIAILVPCRVDELPYISQAIRSLNSGKREFVLVWIGLYIDASARALCGHLKIWGSSFFSKIQAKKEVWGHFSCRNHHAHFSD